MRSETAPKTSNDTTSAITPSTIPTNSPSTVATDSGRETDFTQFPKLPLELRETIWELALPAPKVIDIRRDLSRTGGYVWEPSCQEKMPLLSLACKEAWAVVTRKYKPLRGTKSGSGTIWMDFERDVLCFMLDLSTWCFTGVFELEEFLNALHLQQQGVVRRIMVEQDTWKMWEGGRWDGSKLLSLGVEEIGIGEYQLIKDDDWILGLEVERVGEGDSIKWDRCGEVILSEDWKKENPGKKALEILVGKFIISKKS